MKKNYLGFILIESFAIEKYQQCITRKLFSTFVSTLKRKENELFIFHCWSIKS